LKKKIIYQKCDLRDEREFLLDYNSHSLQFPVHHSHSRSHSREFSVAYASHSHGIPMGPKGATEIPVLCTPLMSTAAHVCRTRR